MTDTSYYTYMIKLRKRTGRITYYIGQTGNLSKRLYQHIQGTGARYTKNKEFLDLIYWLHATRSEAMLHEKQLKKLSRHEKEKHFQEWN